MVNTCRQRYSPPLFFKQLGKLEGDRGAYKLIMAHPDLVEAMAMESAAIDLDTPKHLDDNKLQGNP